MKTGFGAETPGVGKIVVKIKLLVDLAEESSSQTARWRTLLARSIAICATFVWLSGTLLWSTVQDSVPILSGIYYALPLPVLIFVGLIVSTRSLLWRLDCRITAACLLLLEMQIIVWGGQVFPGPAEAPPPEAHRFVFWNVCRGNFGYDSIADELAETDADIIALVEATEDAAFPEFWTSRIPGYSAIRLGSGMMILCRGEILRMQPGNVTVPEEPEAVCRYRIISLQVDGIAMRVLLVDVKSHPLMFRKPAFLRLAELADGLSDQPLIVAADFNTPINSVWVDLLRGQLKNSFEAAGEGYRETWPTLLPVLCLDQVWGNDLITWRRAHHGWSIRSDHRSVTTEFTVSDQSDSAAAR